LVTGYFKARRTYLFCYTPDLMEEKLCSYLVSIYIRKLGIVYVLLTIDVLLNAQVF